MPGGRPREGVPFERLGSKARCDILIEKAYSILKKNEESFSTDFWFILTAGFSKKNKSGSPSIAEQMAGYIKESSHSHFTTRDYSTAWGTYEETAEAIGAIKKIAGHERPAEIYVSTNLGHMPRVRLCWFFLKPKGWKVHFIRAHHTFTKKEWFQETGKFLQYFYRFVFKKW